MWVYTSLNSEETFSLGKRIGERLPPGQVVALYGDLGAGKTLLIKGIAAGAADIHPDEIQSPTFVYLHIIPGRRSLFHFDLYRLRDAEAFLSMGFDEYFFTAGVCCIEWAERITPLLPLSTLKITLHHREEHVRRIEIPLSQAAQLWRS